MDSIITLNLRGTKKQYYKSLLIKSPYFSCLLGESTVWSKTKPNEDESYFVDCDADMFENIISYLEIGELKTFDKYGKEYGRHQFGKFGIKYDGKYIINKAKK